MKEDAFIMNYDDENIDNLTTLEVLNDENVDILYPAEGFIQMDYVKVIPPPFAVAIFASLCKQL